LYSVIGGKLTTYRRLAEEVVDRLARKLGRELRPCETARTPLPGAVSDPVPLCAELVSQAHLPAAVAARLARLYGARASGLADLIRREPALGTPLGASAAVAAEIVFAFEAELALTLADCLMRRSMLGLGRDLGAAVLAPALDVARDHLGWNRARLGEERARFEAESAGLRSAL
jgi:glycerol-3-phosphate dehydrogenase